MKPIFKEKLDKTVVLSKVKRFIDDYFKHNPSQLSKPYIHNYDSIIVTIYDIAGEFPNHSKIRYNDTMFDIGWEDNNSGYPIEIESIFSLEFSIRTESILNLPDK